MSVILDALKKLDREKPYRGSGTSDIATEILESDLDRPVKRIRLYFLIVAFTVVATFIVTYTVMVRFGFLPGSSASKPANPLSLNQQAAPALPEPELRMESSPGYVSPPDESQQVVPAAASHEPVRDVRKKENQMHPKVGVTVEGKPRVKTRTPSEIKPLAKNKPSVETKPPVASQDEKKTVVSEKVEVAPGSAKKTVETTSNVSPTTPPSLRLSAIVWYEDPSMRFAMINGMKAIEGSEIEGVKVVKITPTSIRFLHGGRYFEISMNR